MINYLYSTIKNGTNYVEWQAEGNQLPRIVRSVIIKGGAGMMTNKVLISQIPSFELTRL